MRIYFWRTMNEPLSHHAIAMGFSVGMFIGLGPTFGFQLIPALAIAMRYRYSKLAAAATVFITNPLTVLPIYSFEIYLGDKIWGSLIDSNIPLFIATLKEIGQTASSDTVDRVPSIYSELFTLGRDTMVAFFTGSMLVALLSAIASYFLSKALITKWRNRRKFLKKLR